MLIIRSLYTNSGGVKESQAFWVCEVFCPPRAEVAVLAVAWLGSGISMSSQPSSIALSTYLKIHKTGLPDNMPSSKSGKGCWTCKERKVACDRDSPKCQICLGSGRECKGYGVRLSWPRKDDRKRFLVATSQKQSNMSISLSAELVNVFSSDVKRLHDILDPCKWMPSCQYKTLTNRSCKPNSGFCSTVS
jgi:hypothetical protein